MAYDKLKDLIYPYVMKHYAVMQKQLPYLTGNLAYNAFQIHKTNQGYLAYNAFQLHRTPEGYELSIDLNIAPYAEWIDRPDYRSYQYFDKAFKTFYNNLKADIEGNLHWRVN